MKNIIIRTFLSLATIFLFQSEVISQERNINTYYNNIGIDNNGIKNIENNLLDNGIDEVNIPLVKRCIISIMKDIPDQSREFELSEKNQKYLESDLNLNKSQINTIKSIALRLNYTQKRKEGKTNSNTKSRNRY